MTGYKVAEECKHMIYRRSPHRWPDWLIGLAKESDDRFGLND